MLTVLPPHGRHRVIDIPALRFGSVVALVTTSGLDGPVVRPFSACASLADSLWIGLEGSSRTRTNLRDGRECVVNFPQADLQPSLEQLGMALRAGTLGDGFAESGLTPVPSSAVGPPRVRECYVQIECRLLALHVAKRVETDTVFAELEAVRVHAVEDIVQGDPARIDVPRWRPLVSTFTRIDPVQRSQPDSS